MITLLSTLRKQHEFIKLYEDFCLNKDFSENKLHCLLAIAIVMLNSEEIEVRKFAYRIIVLFSIRTNDYSILYEIAINEKLYPIAKTIDNHLSKSKGNLYTEITAICMENIKQGNKYYSAGQLQMNDFYKKNEDKSVALVAPTSYGKSELMIDTISKKGNICILTPTKSLLFQTKKRIIDSQKAEGRKIITHPDMYKRDNKQYLAILTQERLYRLLKNDPDLKFDIVIVDEAHELLDKSSRELILAIVLIVLYKRNTKTIFKYLTPFIVNPNSLKLKYNNYELLNFPINEYIKTELIYLYDEKRNSLKIYDQFMDRFIMLNQNTRYRSDIDYILSNKSDKNIIYFNSPKEIEKFVDIIIKFLPDIELSDELAKAIDYIAEYTNIEYTMIKCIKKGIIYHHGYVPESIRPYIEYLYKKYCEIQFIITTSTLLQGVNIPAKKIFIMDKRKGKGDLTSSSFKNLIGRVCRFSEIFDGDIDSLKYLIPEIHFVKSDYYKDNANIENYIRKVMKIGKKDEDKIENILLKEKQNNLSTIELNSLKQADEMIENYESGIVNKDNIRVATKDISISCIKNGILDFVVMDVEEELNRRYEEYLIKSNEKIKTPKMILEALTYIFIPFVKKYKRNNSLIRLDEESTRNYYSIFMNWTLKGLSFKEMINNTVSYWNQKEDKSNLVYVGKMGTEVRYGREKLWERIDNKDYSQLVNIAINKIKVEQDFVSYDIMKYIEIMNDLQMIDTSFYNQLKYGFTDQKAISLVMNGFSSSLAKLVIEKYINYIHFNFIYDTITIDNEIIENMKNNNENGILIFEMTQNISQT